MAIRSVAVLFLTAFLLPAYAADQGPGYGVVQSIVRLPGKSAEPSASAGASSPSQRKSKGPAYLVRIKMDDGRFQIREVKKREVGVGQRVLITNAGDVLPE